MNLEKVMSGFTSLQNNDNIRNRAVNTNRTAATQIQHKESVTLHDENVINRQEVETVVEKLNEFIDPLRTNLKFVFHEQLNEYYVAVVNPLTNEVIKEIPPKKMLDMYAEMAEFMGILIDKKI